MSEIKEFSDTNIVDQISGIRFSILSPDEIRRMSVVEIYKSDTYNGRDAVPHGLFDERLGVLERNKICLTCEQSNDLCPGHFGHINLGRPVFYIQFFDYVKKILQCICFRCSKLLIDPENPKIKVILNKKLTRQKRWDLISKLCSKPILRCGKESLTGCGAKQPDKITKDPTGILRLIFEWKKLENKDDNTNSGTHKQYLIAEKVYRIFRRISDSDAEILGFSKKFNRPEWMICTVFPVPPPSVRPSVRTETGQRSEDDLTHKLCDIIKSNRSLKNNIDKNKSREAIDISTYLLQYHVSTFIDNTNTTMGQAQQRSGRPFKSLIERLKSKDGRIRGNLMGKRVDFSARSVITPDPNISIDELGVPLKIAMNLTFPEVVNQYNINKLKNYIINGCDIYPGAKFIKLEKDGRIISLKTYKNRNEINLSIGDIVERHLMNDDVVLFNRQPSLHRMSMLAHRVKVMPYNTFRLNVCVTPCYNADKLSMSVTDSCL